MALRVAPSLPKLPLGDQLARMPAHTVRTRIDDSPWWSLPGIPEKNAWLSLRGPLETARDIHRLQQMLGLLVRVNAFAADLLDVDAVDSADWESLREGFGTLLEALSDGYELPADYQLARIATSLWGDAPWAFWDESLRTALLAQRVLVAEGRSPREIATITLGLLLRDIGWALVYRRLRSQGRERVMERHPAIAAAMLNGFGAIPRMTIAVVSEHHRVGHASTADGRDRLSRGTLAGQVGSILTRLVELETSLIPSGASGPTIRQLALDALLAELVTSPADLRWGAALQKILAGTAARARLLAPQRLPLAEHRTLHSPEAGAPATHGPLSHRHLDRPDFDRPDSALVGSAELSPTQSLVREAYAFGKGAR